MRFFLFLLILACVIGAIALLVRHLMGAKLERQARREVHHKRMDEYDTDEESAVLDKVERKRRDSIKKI
ncbi:hypothetical protein ACFL96_14060 [Thermoproteota archaeon]